MRSDDIPDLSVRASRCLSAWQQCWQQSRPYYASSALARTAGDSAPWSCRSTGRSGVFKHFPAVDVTGGEHRMHQLTKRRLVSRSEDDSSRRYCFERIDQPVKGPLRILEAVDKNSMSPVEATPEEFHAVGHSTAVARVRRKDLFDGRVLVCAVVPPKAGKLDLYGPVRHLPYREITRVAARQVTAACSGVMVEVSVGCLHLCERHCHSVVFGERPDARLVPPGGVTVAIRLRLLVICCFHGSREITYDAIEIHNCRLGDIQLEPGERHAFQDSVAGSIRWESDRYTGPRTTAGTSAPWCSSPPSCLPSALGPRPVLLRPLPRTRLLPNLVTDGFGQGRLRVCMNHAPLPRRLPCGHRRS